MTISTQVLKPADKAKLRKMIREASQADRDKLHKKLGKLIKESIEEIGDPGINDAIAAKIKARILRSND